MNEQARLIFLPPSRTRGSTWRSDRNINKETTHDHTKLLHDGEMNENAEENLKKKAFYSITNANRESDGTASAAKASSENQATSLRDFKRKVLP
jgi:hypothetical protein